MSVATPISFSDILESLAHGKPPNENDNHVNGGGPRMRHRGHEAEPEVSAQGATESSKSYTAEQLEAVRKLVHMSKCCFVLPLAKCHSETRDYYYVSSRNIIHCPLLHIMCQVILVGFKIP